MLAAMVLVAVLVVRGTKREGDAGGDIPVRGPDAADRVRDPAGGLTRPATVRESGERKPTPELSGSDAARAAALRGRAEDFLRDAEQERAVAFATYEDAEGNSSSTMLLERPTSGELKALFGRYLGSLTPEDRRFVEETGLSAVVKKDIADFFGYDAEYRYVTFLLAGDGSATLPTVLVLESDRLYDGELASEGRLDVPAGELRLKDHGDLKAGDPKLERYGRLFSLK